MFDDGYQNTYTNAFPALTTAGVKATVYVTTNGLDAVGGLTTAQVQEMYAAGIDIGNHTNTHPHMPTLTEAQQEAELSAAKGILDAAGMTRASAHVSYPYGQNNADTATAMAATGMLTGRTTALGFASLVNVHDGLGINKIPLYVYPPDFDADVAAIKAKLDYAKSHKDIVCLLFHQIVETPVGAYEFAAADFIEVLNYINTLGLTSMTISEWYTAYMAEYGA